MEDKARPIQISYPSGKVRMIMWQGTEDEKSFPVYGIKSGKPYINAYGTRYELTKKEIEFIKAFV